MVKKWYSLSRLRVVLINNGLEIDSVKWFSRANGQHGKGKIISCHNSSPFFKAFNLPNLQQQSNNFQLRTHSRYCTILPSFIGHTFHVHNGKDYIPVKITEEMVGHRLGEFSHTKKPAKYTIQK